MHFNVLNTQGSLLGVEFCRRAPVGVMIVKGLLLQMKKQWTWVQPPEQRGTGTLPTLSLDDILDRVKTVPGLEVDGWEDVNRLDVRPGRGMVKVWLMNNWEVQVDLSTGAILQTAYRRSDWIESIHDGSVFAGDWTKLGLFLPTASRCSRCISRSVMGCITCSASGRGKKREAAAVSAGALPARANIARRQGGQYGRGGLLPIL